MSLKTILAAGFVLALGASPLQAGDNGWSWYRFFHPQSSGPNYPRPNAAGLMPSANWVWGTTKPNRAFRFRCYQAQFNGDTADIRAFCPDRFWW